MRQREDGSCLAYSKSDGKAFVLARSEHDRLKRDWMAGKAFFEGQQFYGSAICLKLSDIMAVVDISPECDAAMREDTRLSEREDSIES